MNTHTRTNRPWPPYITPLTLGVSVGVVTATLLLLLCALLIEKLAVPAGAVTAMALVAVGVGGLAGGFTTGLGIKKNGLLWGALCGTLLYLILLMAGLARGGVAPGYAAIKWAVLTVCSAAGGVVGVNRRQP